MAARPNHGHAEYVGTLSQMEAPGCSLARVARFVVHEGRAQRLCKVESRHGYRSVAWNRVSQRGNRLDRTESRPTLCEVRSEDPCEAVQGRRAMSALWLRRIEATESFKA